MKKHWIRFRKYLRRLKNQNIRKYWLHIVGIMTALTFFVFAFVYGLFSIGLPSADELLNASFSENTKITDRSGNILYEIHGEEKRKTVSLDQISPTLIDATLSLEDDDFYSHPGFDWKAIARSSVCVAQRTVRVVIPFIPNCLFSGASTITQQFVKLNYLSSEITVTRKIRELILAVRLENAFEKNKILEMYLNRIPYGGTIYGIETASQTYFGKHAKDLSLMESALLASIPSKPSKLSPYSGDREKLRTRAEFALGRMLEEGKITEEQKAEALGEEIVFQKFHEEIHAPHFVWYVRDQLEEVLTEQYGESEAQKLIKTGGLTVTSTLDRRMQEIGEEVVVKNMKKAASSNAENGSLVAQDPRTGEILTMVGSKDYFSEEIDGKVNIATSERQPGSSLKPMVYTEAFLQGYAPSTVIYDVKTSFGSYNPKNYTGNFSGPVSIRKALQTSLNIPAVKILSVVGVEKAVELGRKMGLTSWDETSADRCGLSLVLGGCETRLIDMIQVYSVFANLGQKPIQKSILNIQDKNGKILFQNNAYDKESIFSEAHGYLMHSILSDNSSRASIFGSNNKLYLPGYDSGAKTGTTDDNKDAWTLGYVKNLVAGAWVGNNMPTPMKQSGSMLAAPIWNEFMLKALALPEYKNPGKYEKPSSVISAGVSTLSGKLPSTSTPKSRIKSDYFVQGKLPPSEPAGLVVEAIICRDSGLLASESCPESEKQTWIYEKHIEIFERSSWQAAINAWYAGKVAASKEKTNANVLYIASPSEIPTEYDSTFAEKENDANITLTWSKEPPKLVSYAAFTASFLLKSTVPVMNIKVFVNKKLISTIPNPLTENVYSFEFTPKSDIFTENSPLNILVIASGENNIQSRISGLSTLKTDIELPVIEFLSPTATIGATVEAIDLSAKVSDNKLIQTVEFFIDGAPIKTFAEVNATGIYSHSLAMNEISAGKHTFTVRAYDASQNDSKSVFSFTVEKAAINPEETPAPTNNEEEIVSEETP